MSKVEIGRGAAYLFAETITTMFSSYIFWLFISRFASAELIGMYSSIVSLSTIFIALICIGVPSGVQRFLGKSFKEQNLEDSRTEVISSILLVSLGVLLCIGTIVTSRAWMHDIFGMDDYLLLLLVVLVASNSAYLLLRAIIISTLKTKNLTKITVISTVAKFSVAIFLVMAGEVSLGIALSTAIFPILLSILLALNVIRLLKPSMHKRRADTVRTSLQESIKNIFVASIAGWIPNLVNITGSQLGIIVINGAQGAAQAGLYFISYSVVAGVLTITAVLQTIAYPALSAMYDGRKRFAWRMLKMTLIIVMPLSSSIMFFSRDIVQIFGQQYIQSYATLELMMLSVLPTSIAGFVSILVYAYGNYKEYVGIGIAINIPRVVLYFLLVPLYGDDGAAVSFVLGSVSGLIASVIVVRKIKMRLSWSDLILLFIIPSGLAFVLQSSGTSFILAIVITIIVSYLLFLRFKILDRTDLTDILTVLPQKIGNPRVIRLVTLLAKKINPSF
jgi:O-antigen/teichoic acid export membrane protein